MSAAYQRELDFTIRLLERLRMPVRIVRPGEPLRENADGLRMLTGMTAEHESTVRITAYCAGERTIFKVLDPYLCHYICFHLPDASPAAVAVLGPYLTADPQPGELLEIAEALKLPISVQPQLSDYFASLPVYHDSTMIMSIVATLGEQLWGGREFGIVDVNEEQPFILPDSASAAAPTEQESILQRMQMMEARYAYEDELMSIVSKGLTNQAEVLMSSVSQLNYQSRVSDPLRNMKNYCIICNTILRKAAQQGGVHPLQLDEISSRYARVIETAPTLEKCSPLIGEMIRSYCRLVRSHTGRNCSAIVQKVLTYISANLSGDLSLTTLSGLLQITPSYLSTLFRRETGHTLAEHITDSRMKAALQLLKSTRLQVQSIAQLCGYSDPNYFTRQFRRFYGVTPLQYRRDQPVPAASRGG